MRPTIAYELHDSTIVSVSIGPRREASLWIDLYPISYPDRQRVLLRFGGILNFDAVARYFKSLKAEADDEYIGCRIDSFQCDTKKESTAGDYWFFLETAWCGPIRIHCAKMSLREQEG